MISRCLKSLRSPGCDCSQGAVNFRGRRAQNQVAEGSPCNCNVLVGTQNMDLVICQHDSGLSHVLNGVLRPPALASHPANGPGKMVALQGLHILDLEAVDEQVVEPDERQSIFNFEAEDKGPNKVCSLLQGGRVLRVLASPHLHVPGFQVEPNLKFQMLHNWLEDLHPVLFQRSVTVAWNWDLSHLRAISQFFLLNGWEGGLEWGSHTGHHGVNVRHTSVRFRVRHSFLLSFSDFPFDGLLGHLERHIRVFYDSFNFHLSLVEVNQAIKAW